MTEFQPRDPDFADRVRASFARQAIMHTFGATLDEVSPGAVTISMPYRADLTQQHGFLHAGVVSTVLDSALGYAAFSLMAPDAAVLTAEFKVNLIAPAQGERIVARGRVLKPGRTLTVCTGDVHAISGGRERLVATMQATLMAVAGREGIEG